MYELFVIIVSVILLCILLGVWLWFMNSKLFIACWNDFIKSECDQQDSRSFNGIPSYHNAWETNNKSVRELHQLIHLYNNDILSEVTPLLNKDLSVLSIRDKGRLSEVSELCPILRSIVSLFPDVIKLQVLIYYPGIAHIELQEQYRMLQRYHYGLKIPVNDIGLKISGFDVKWEEHEGYVWDATLPHSIWNHTNDPRIIIYADVSRDLSLIKRFGSKLITTLINRNTVKHELLVK